MSASHKGKTHTQESRDKMGVSKKGQNNPAYGRTGELNPMFGVSAPNAQEIYIYGKDNVLIKSFSSQVAAAEWLKVHQSSVSRYIKSGKYLMNKYYITNKLITELIA
jgi:group I intron endonuclease